VLHQFTVAKAAHFAILLVVRYGRGSVHDKILNFSWKDVVVIVH
jgi:hypothetical protein